MAFFDAFSCIDEDAEQLSSLIFSNTFAMKY